jgi:hypothetical protein
MGWVELTVDVFDADSVHEVIAWAEEYLVKLASEAGWEHTYCLYARIPAQVLPEDEQDAPLFLHIAGLNPTAADEPFSRMHPFR